MDYEGFAHDGERFQRNPQFIFRRIVDEAVLVPIHQQVADMRCIYTLNEVGAFVWEKLDVPTARVELERAILDEYEVLPEVAARDLDEFLRGMVEIGSIRRL